MLQRETKKISLPISKCKVEYYTYFTRAERLEIQDTMMNGVKIVGDKPENMNMKNDNNAKDRALSFAIVNVKDDNGSEISEIGKFLANLPEEDWDELIDLVDVYGLKKKSTQKILKEQSVKVEVQGT